MKPLACCLALAVLVACEAQPHEPRFESPDDHFSIRELDSWEPQRQLGSVVFVSSGDEQPRNTIAVRAIDLADGGA
jgi:hypothetical protein